MVHSDLVALGKGETGDAFAASMPKPGGLAVHAASCVSERRCDEREVKGRAEVRLHMGGSRAAIVAGENVPRREFIPHTYGMSGPAARQGPAIAASVVMWSGAEVIGHTSSWRSGDTQTVHRRGAGRHDRGIRGTQPGADAGCHQHDRQSLRRAGRRLSRGGATAGRRCPRRDRTCHHTPRKTLRSLSVTNAGSLTIIGWTFCPLCQSRAGHRLPVPPRITQVRFLFSDN